MLTFRANLARIPRKDGASGLSGSRFNHFMGSLRLIMNEAAERYEFGLPLQEHQARVMLRRHLVEQNLTSSQTFAHFRRQLKGRWQTGQTFVGRFGFLCVMCLKA